MIDHAKLEVSNTSLEEEYALPIQNEDLLSLATINNLKKELTTYQQSSSKAQKLIEMPLTERGDVLASQRDRDRNFKRYLPSVAFPSSQVTDVSTVKGR